MEKLKEIFVPSLLSSAVSLGIYHFYLGEDLTDTAPLLSVMVPAYVAVGVSALTGSIAGEFLSDIIIPKIPIIERLGSLQEAIVPPTITGLSTYGSIMLLVDSNASFGNSFLLGAGSSAISKYAYKMI